MIKVYFNMLNNKAIVINETTHTYTLIRATEMKQKDGDFFYQSKMRRLIEIKNGLLERGFQRA